jgi:hypothetical protein
LALETESKIQNLKSKIRWPVLLLAGVAGLLPAGGCASTWSGGLRLPNSGLGLPDASVLIRDQLVIHSDSPVPSQHRLIEELVLLRTDLHERLGTPLSNEPIHVYLFGNEERFAKYLRMYHPLFPSRRAFFMETDTRLTVYAYWGDRVADDLRHEVTHGYLHAVCPRIPLWLDEGLAEYFEVPRGTHGLNRPKVELLAALMARGPWQPDLARLESIEPTVDMTQQQYAEAWAWVHWLLEAPMEGHALLPRYLADLRRDGTAAPISARLRPIEPEPARALTEHLRRLAARSALPR